MAKQFTVRATVFLTTRQFQQVAFLAKLDGLATGRYLREVVQAHLGGQMGPDSRLYLAWQATTELERAAADGKPFAPEAAFMAVNRFIEEESEDDIPF